MERILQSAGKVEVVVVQPDTLIFYSQPEQVKVLFFKYDVPLIGEGEVYRNRVVLASDMDIVAMKAVAIAQRGSKKDFFDLWFLMHEHGWNLGDLERFIRAKYPSWNFGIFLRALTYFDDAEHEIHEDIDPVWERVKDYFRSAVYTYTDIEEDPGYSPSV